MIWDARFTLLLTIRRLRLRLIKKQPSIISNSNKQSNSTKIFINYKNLHLQTRSVISTSKNTTFAQQQLILYHYFSNSFQPTRAKTNIKKIKKNKSIAPGNVATAGFPPPFQITPIRPPIGLATKSLINVGARPRLVERVRLVPHPNPVVEIAASRPLRHLRRRRTVTSPTLRRRGRGNIGLRVGERNRVVSEERGIGGLGGERGDGGNVEVEVGGGAVGEEEEE